MVTEKVLSLRAVAVRGPSGAELLSGVDLDLGRGDRLGVVGPSGAGKSMLLRAATGFLPPGCTVSGSIRLAQADGELVELVGMPTARRRELVTARCAILGQNSMGSLNPYRTIGVQLAETLQRHHREYRRPQLREISLDWLRRAGLPEPGLLGRYPHQLSGGMRQRVAITLSLCGPQPVVLADEPTTALDVVRQDECIRLLDELSRGLGRSLVYVSHDLALTARLCTQVAVVSQARVVELGPVEQVFGSPQHPVTRRLVHSTREVRPA